MLTCVPATRLQLPRLVAVLGLTAGLAAAAEPWHWPEAQFRKRIKVEEYAGEARTVTTDIFVPALAEGKPAGMAFYDAAGKTRPVRVINRCGSRLKLVFDGASGESLWAEMGPAAPAGEEPPLRSGLLHESRVFNGETVDTAAQFELLWKAASPQGGRFEEQVFASYNPFGLSVGSLHRYEGMLSIEAAGDYAFCTASNDASFLLVDGRAVVSWPGRHGIEGSLGGEKRGTIALSAGTHRFAYLHASCSEPLYAIAAWIPPGEKQHRVIPPESFAAAAYARVGRLESRDPGEVPDFTWENQYMATFDPRVVHRFEFEAASASAGDSASFEWDFGDGTRGSGRAVSHCYFVRGEYGVTLTVSAGGASRRLTQRVAVAPRYGQSENDEAAALALLRQGVTQEQAGGIQPEGYATIILGFLFYLQEQAAAEFTPRVLARAGDIPDGDVFPLLYRLGRDLQGIGEHYDLAEECFRIVLDREPKADLRSEAVLHFAGMLIHCLDRPSEAEKLLDSLPESSLPDEWERRLLHIYRADCALVLDGMAAARKGYAAVPPYKPLVVAGELDRKALFDYNSRYLRLRNLLSQKLYPEALEEVDILEWECPEEKMSSALNLLKVEALAGNGQPHKAIVCLERALLAAADDNLRPQLRLKLAELCLANGLLAKARIQAELIRRESPQSPDEIAARELLAEVERRVQEARQ